MRKKPYTTKEFSTPLQRKYWTRTRTSKKSLITLLLHPANRKSDLTSFPQRSVLITAEMRGFTLIFVSVEICQEIPDKRTKPSTLGA